MVNKDIIPAAFNYMNVIADTEFKMQRVFSLCEAGLTLLKKLNDLINDLSNASSLLAEKHEATKKISNLMDKAKVYTGVILPAMDGVRSVADQIEPLLGQDYKPFPSYEDLLYSV